MSLTLGIAIDSKLQSQSTGGAGLTVRLRKTRSKIVIAGLASAAICVQGYAQAQSGDLGNDAVQLELPSAPLSTTLVELGDALGVNIIGEEALLRGKAAPRITGRLTPPDAIDRALSGSDLTWRRSSNGSFIVIPREARAVPAASRSNVENAEASDLSPSDAQPTEAQTPDAPLIAGNIIVTGQQIDRTLQETKESVAVLTAEDIEIRSLFDIEDVLLQSANVTFSDPGSSNISIRGVSRIPFAIGGVGDTSTTFYDDVAITNQGVQFISQNLWDVQQVEFLRGPQSTNLGRNALIGALVIRTNDPDPEAYDAALRTEIGNFGTYSLEAMVNVPIASNTALRIAGEQSQTDGFIDNVTFGRDDDGRREFTTLRAKLLTEFSDQFRATASLQYVDGDTASQSYIAQLDGPFDTFESSANIQPFYVFEGITGSLNLELDVSDAWALQSITAFSDADSDRQLDGDGTERDGGGSAFPNTQFNVSQEVRATYTGEKLRGVIGGYYLDDEQDSEFIVSGRINPALVGVPQSLLPFYPALLAFNQSTASDRKTTNFAVFTQWEYALTDRLLVSAGLRYDRETVSALTDGQSETDASTPLPDPVEAGALAEMLQPGSGALVQGGVAAVNAALLAQLGSFAESTETTFEAFLPEFGISFNPSPDIKTSLFYKRGYRAGGARLDTTGRLNEFNPEYLDNFELSIRSKWFDDTLTLNANAYYGFWIDQQINVPIDGNEFNRRTENSGESRIWGVEIDANYRPSARTELFASIGYAETEFVEYCSLSSTATGLADCEIDGAPGKDLSGNEFGVSPDWTASLGGQRYLTDRIYAQANLTYQGGAFGDAENRPNLRTDAFFLANANVGYEGDTYDLRVYVRNLFDEFYETKRFNGELPSEVGISPGAPREYGLVVSARF